MSSQRNRTRRPASPATEQPATPDVPTPAAAVKTPPVKATKPVEKPAQPAAETCPICDSRHPGIRHRSQDKNEPRFANEITKGKS